MTNEAQKPVAPGTTKVDATVTPAPQQNQSDARDRRMGLCAEGHLLFLEGGQSAFKFRVTLRVGEL